MLTIIHYLLFRIQELEKTICQLVRFITKYIPLRQMAFDDSKSPKYQKFKIDKLPVIKKFVKQDYRFLIAYYEWKYNKSIKPIKRRKTCTVPENTICPRCSAPHEYIYDNNGKGAEFLCKVCAQTFQNGKLATSTLKLECPYCNHSLSQIKNRKHFVIHKCVNDKCSYYKNNKKQLPKDLPQQERHKYKLHYIYREFVVDFFKIDLNSLPERASSFKFRKASAHIMGLCMTYHINYGISLRKTSLIMKDVHKVDISHTMIANYAKTAASVIKPFVDSYPYKRSNTFIADETYVKVKGIKGYIWFVLDAVSRSVLGYRVSDNRGVGACILAMRMAFGKMSKLPDDFRFVADGYSAYPLAAQQFALREEDPLEFDITQVIGLTNDDAVSAEFRPFKQIVERFNRTYKTSYRPTCGYDNFEGANYDVTLWVAYYNFLRPHSILGKHKPLNEIDMLSNADTMPAKWQLLLFLGQQSIQNLTAQPV